MTRIILTNCLCLFSFFAFSQDRWEGGLLFGYSNYLGDMVEPAITFDQATLAGGALLRFHYKPNIKLRSNLVFAKIEGADANYEGIAMRGASFESDIIEMSLVGEYEFLGHKRFDERGEFQKVFSPYLFLGGGVAFTASTIDLNTSDAPSDLKQEDLVADFNRNLQFALPIGVGVKLDVSRRLNLGLEWGWRMTFSDYLDGLSLAGDPDNDDMYIIGGLTAGFLFGDNDTDDDGIADKEDKCPYLPGILAMEGCPDQDGDGITDEEDECPIFPGKIRLNGCPDRDEDGVADNVDDCPDDKGLKRFAGCPDTDFDGIVDQEDNCPEEAGIASMNGCPDADRDGVEDIEDECPNTPGPINQKGCPDSDKDGLVDSDDECPVSAGPLELKGCPDSDRDGIADKYDKCPETQGTAKNEGCPEIKKEDKETLDLAMSNVRFETGSAILLDSSFQVLDKIVDIMERYPDFSLSINGYTDDVGDDISNQQLSEQRAQTCFDYLVKKEVSPERIKFAGYGENNPIGDNMSLEGRERNRRVEFILDPG